jgi:hypothetical protein
MFLTNKRISFSANGGIHLTGRNGVSNNRVTPLKNPMEVSGANSETASFGWLGSGPNPSRTSTMGMNPSALLMLTGLISDQHQLMLNLLHDIYRYDAVCGSAVDMISNFPFSNFSLTGVKKSELEKFEESIARLNFRTLMPEISVAHLVDGAYIGTPVFDSRQKVFVDIMNHPLASCTVIPSPFHSVNSSITVHNNSVAQRFLNSDSSVLQQLHNTFNAKFLAAIQAPQYALNSVTSLYIPRRTIPGMESVSYLQRVLPMYILEKQMFRGTLVEVYKRQRSMLHVQAGDDTWEATIRELDSIGALFQQAEQDPNGAVVTTRQGVQATELRQGGEFWKWTDMLDTTTPYKLRALGISEAFLSADANFSNSETALSVFLEEMDAYRSKLTYMTINNRLFPVVALDNGFFDESKVQANRRKDISYWMNNQHALRMPRVVWEKQLSARSEENRIETLNTLEEKGFPVTLRMWAAAARMDFDTLEQEWSKDKADRALIQKYKNELREAGVEDVMGNGEVDENAEGEPVHVNGGEGGDGEYPEAARLHAALRVASYMNGKVRRVPLLAREFNDGDESRDKSSTGKDRFVVSARRKRFEGSANDKINRAMRNIERDPSIQRNAVAKVRRHIASVMKL